MDHTPGEQPADTKQTPPAQTARQAREAAALRANLLRRKQQARERAGDPLPEAE